jgi:UDP-sugar transporter A1/2/3
MGATSVAMALLAVYSKDGAVVAEKGFFYGYNQAVIGVILLQALGGLVVALVVVHADNIMKGFGSSISIVLSCTLEWLFFDFQPSLRFVLGAGLVNFALFVYQNEGLPRLLVGPGSSSSSSAGGSGVGGGGGKEGKIGSGGVTALLVGLVGAGGAGGNSSSSSGGSSSSTGGGILPFVHIPKSHARDVKGWFGSGAARKAALSPPSAASQASALYLPLKNGFDSSSSSSSSPAGGTAEWRQPHASSSGSRGREGGGVKALV